MSDMNDTAFHDAPPRRDFGSDGVSENPFGQDAGAGGGDGIGSTFRDHTQNLRSQATDKLRSFADEGKLQVTNSIDGVVDAAREVANRIGQYGGPLAGYADTAADTLESWAQMVKDKSVDDLIDEGRDFIRKQPQLAIGIAVAGGFALSRFLKVSGGRYD